MVFVFDLDFGIRGGVSVFWFPGNGHRPFSQEFGEKYLLFI